MTGGLISYIGLIPYEINPLLVAMDREKYRRFDRGERMPPDWRAHG
jgi:hypothetical protein